MKHNFLMLSIILVLIALISCNDSSKKTTEKPAGSEGGPCYGNDTCDDGLVCLSDLCVNPEDKKDDETVSDSDEAADEGDDWVSDEASDEAGDEVAEEASDEAVDETAEEDSDEVTDDVEETIGVKVSTHRNYTHALKNGRLAVWYKMAKTATPLDLEGIEEKDIIDISTGSDYSCVVLKDGAVYCWYHSEDWTVTPSLTPFQVMAASNYNRILAYKEWQCGITVYGNLECWGTDVNLIFHDGDKNQVITDPVILAENITKAKVSYEGIAAIDEDGNTYSWQREGKNSKIVLELGIEKAKDLCIAASYPCIITYEGNIRCSDSALEFRTIEWDGFREPSVLGDNEVVADVEGNVYVMDRAEKTLVKRYNTVGKIVSIDRSSSDGDTFCWVTIDGKIWCAGAYPGDGTDLSEDPVEITF